MHNVLKKRRKRLEHACEKKVMGMSARLREKTKKFEKGEEVRALLNNSHIAQTRRKRENEAERWCLTFPNPGRRPNPLGLLLTWRHLQQVGYAMLQTRLLLT